MKKFLILFFILTITPISTIAIGERPTTSGLYKKMGSSQSYSQKIGNKDSYSKRVGYSPLNLNSLSKRVGGYGSNSKRIKQPLDNPNVHHSAEKNNSGGLFEKIQKIFNKI